MGVFTDYTVYLLFRVDLSYYITDVQHTTQ